MYNNIIGINMEDQFKFNKINENSGKFSEVVDNKEEYMFIDMDE